jgi:hypothetical protein
MAGKMLFVSENWKWWQDQLDFHKATEDDDEVEVMEELVALIGYYIEPCLMC